ncbi:MAG TPA: hypothetical protein VMV29_05295 [Ktedonobacterales bacterium]|nr:hypothetical protein [Ktedonobacterales bacterium]
MPRPANSGRPPNQNPSANRPANDNDEDEDDDFDPQEYDALLRLERLESMEEEMQELGVTTLDEVRRRIEELHRQQD